MNVAIPSRPEFEALRMQLAVDNYTRLLEIGAWELECKKANVKPTLAKYKRHLRAKDTELHTWTYEQEVAELSTPPKESK